MERTRIVHYTHSRTPLILSPSSPNPPRLASISSISSVISDTDDDIDDDKAPLASIDIDFPSTPRRSSRSSDQNGTSEQTNVFDQDLPVAEGRKDNIPNGDVRKKRSSSDATPQLNENSPNVSMDAAMRRNTLGSWSRSRRKPQDETPKKSTSSPRNSSTLPHRGASSASSDTLVKSRRRYTWLSSKQSSGQGATVIRPQHLDSVNNDIAQQVNYNTPDSMSPVKSPLSPLRQHNDISEDDLLIVSSDGVNGNSTFPRTCKTKTSLIDQNKRSIDSHQKDRLNRSYECAKSPKDITSRQHSMCFGDSNSTNSISPSSRKSSTVENSYVEHGCSNRDLVNSSSQNNIAPSSPKTEINSGSPTNYNWRRDPRRRPCNFVDSFDLSPPQSPPELTPDIQAPPSSIIKSSPSPSKKQQNKKTPSPPSNKKQETSFTSRISTIFGSEKCNNKMSGSSESSTNSYVSYDGPDNDLTFDDKTPVNELESPLMAHILSNTNSDKRDDFTTSSSPRDTRKNDNGCRLGQSQTSPTKENLTCSDGHKEGYRDCLVRDSIKNGTDNIVVHKRYSDYSNANYFKSDVTKNTNLTKKSKSVSVCSDETSDKSIGSILKSPRTRNSFRIAVGSNWDDVFPTSDSLSRLPDISEDKALSPKRAIRKPTTSEEDVFISCDNLINGGVKTVETCIDEVCDVNVSYDRNNGETSSHYGKKVPLINNTLIEDGQKSGDYDSLNRRIKRNSMRLATASLSDITSAIDDIDINMDNRTDNYVATDSLNQSSILDEKTQTSCRVSPHHPRQNLSRTGSLLSSKNSSSFGSFYSCKSNDANESKNSPVSNVSHRKELRARLDSPLVNRPYNNYDNKMDLSFPSSTRTSSPVSIASSGRSSHRQRPAYYWTRQAPYPRLLYARSGSVASSRGSGGYRTSSPQPSITSSIHTDISHTSNSKRSNDINGKTTANRDTNNSHYSRTIPQTDDRQRRSSTSSSRSLDRRSMTLPISNPYYTSYTPDLSPSSVLESPNSNAVRSPPSLGRPKRKQYAGFDCQPLPMDSFMSDSSSVYTGVSCSSRGTDMTGQPDNAQFDESFMSEEVQSCFEDESRGDISFDGSEILQPTSLLSDITFTKDMEENESKRGSVHSTSTTKQENGDSSADETKFRDDSSVLNSSDDFIEHNSDHHIGIRDEKQFGSEYDALFRLYKTDDLFKTPSYSLYSQNGKAFSSSCLLRAQLYSKRKFFSTRDIFDLLRDSDKTRPDATVSLTSLERHAHKVCEAILCCDEMDQEFINNETHSLV